MWVLYEHLQREMKKIVPPPCSPFGGRFAFVIKRFTRSGSSSGRVAPPCGRKFRSPRSWWLPWGWCPCSPGWVTSQRPLSSRLWWPPWRWCPPLRRWGTSRSWLPFWGCCPCISGWGTPRRPRSPRFWWWWWEMASTVEKKLYDNQYISIYLISNILWKATAILDFEI